MALSVRKHRLGILLLAAGALVAGGAVLAAVGSGETEPGQPGAAPIASEPQPPAKDQRPEDLLLGAWEDDYQGKRTMTLREDGTGTMVVELSGLKASLFASKLEFDLKWSLRGGRLAKQTVGGRPEAQVKMILKALGDRVEEPVLELTEDRLLLLDQDGKTRYAWRRVRSPRAELPSHG